MQIRLAAKDKLRRQAISRKYTISKGAIAAKDRHKAIAEKLKQQSKKGKGKAKARLLLLLRLVVTARLTPTTTIIMTSRII